MSLTQYYTATTLDGFIADPDHSLAWLFTRKREPGGPLSYDTFITDVGALAMGRTTYEWIPRARVRREGPLRLALAVRRPLLGLHASRAACRPGCAHHVHERRRRDGAR